MLQTLAHGALGCAEAGLTGGNCGAGAAGAATESILGNLVTLPSTAQGTVSRTDATVYATSAAILGAVAGQAADGHALSGTNTAINSAVNNRLLHPDEQKTLAQMKKGQSPQEQYRLSAAACADTHCAAGLPANTPHIATLEALQATGQNYPLERAQLRETHLFGYSSWNAITDAASRYEALTRVTGAIQAAGGLVGYTAGGGMIAAGCETGLACVAGFALATTSADYAQAGYRQMVSGTDTPTLGQQVLTDLGLSPTTAAWTYAAMSLGAGVSAGAASAVTAADGVGAGAAETGVGGIGAGGNSAAENTASPVTARNFFGGSRYTSKVLDQSTSGDYHGFPQSVDAFSGDGTVTSITGGDGVTRWRLTIPGSYKGQTSVFEFIRNPDGTINHRLFVPNG